MPGTGIALPEGTVDRATTQMLAPDTVTVTVYNDLDGDGVRDDNEPGLAGWRISQGCSDALYPLITDANGIVVARVMSGDDCFHLERQFGWLPTRAINLGNVTPEELTQNPPVFAVHDYGDSVMELRGEAIYGGLPSVQGEPGIAEPYHGCGHLFVEYAGPSLTRVGVISSRRRRARAARSPAMRLRRRSAVLLRPVRPSRF